MRFALVQMHCAWGKVRENLSAMECFARQARDRGCHMAVFPELTTTGIFKDDRVWDLAEDVEGESVRFVRDLARAAGLAIAFGFTESGAPLPYNAYAIIGADGALAGVYRKNHIAPLEVPWWQGHGAGPVFEIAGARFAVSICWDNTYPELLAAYGQRGAEVVLMPHAWDADPLAADGTDLPHATIAELFDHCANGRVAGWRDHDGMREQFYRFIPQRARENGFHALFVNQAGQPHPAIRFEGPTFAVDRDGRILAETSNGEEQVVFADLEVGR
jgi:predicted amidohydrolase